MNFADGRPELQRVGVALRKVIHPPIILAILIRILDMESATR